MRRLRALVTILVVSMWALTLVWLPGLPAQALPGIGVSPGSAPPGHGVSVTGSDFSPTGGSIVCRIHLTTSLNPPTSFNNQVGTCTVNSNRALSGSFTVPAVAAGSYRVWACVAFSETPCSDEFSEGASAPFTVSAPPTTTTTTSTTTTSSTSTTSTTQPSTTTTSTTSTTQPSTTTTSTTSTTQPSTTTTSTTLPIVPLFGDIDPFVLDTPIPNGMGLGPGFYGSATLLPITPTVELPREIVWRCAIPPRATIRDFDRPIGLNAADYLVFDGSNRGTRFEPAVGTISGTVAVSVDAFQPAGYGETTQWGSTDGYVGMHVGLQEPTRRPVTIRLVGWDYEGNLLDLDQVTLGPEATPATNCLVVKAGRSSIRRIAVISFGTDQPVMVDRVFTGFGYPVAPEPITFEVDLTFPRDGLEIDAARTTNLIGVITSPLRTGIDRVQVTMPNWTTGGGIVVREAHMTGWFPSSTGTYKRLFILDGVRVPPGRHRITATASGELGTASDSLTLVGTGAPFLIDAEYRTEIAGEVDIVPWALEVTQAVRGPLEIQPAGSTITDEFPLVAGKKTVVRGYAVQQFPGGAPARVQHVDVTARLYGVRNGTLLEGSPLTPIRPSATIGNRAPGPEAEAAARPYLGRSFDFVIPYTWTTGDVLIYMEVNPATSIGAVVEAPGRGGRLNSIGRTVSFTELNSITVSSLEVEYFWRCNEAMLEQWFSPCGVEGRAVGDQVSAAPNRDDVRNAIRGWWKTLPAPGEYPRATSHSTVQLAQRNATPPVRLDDPVRTGPVASMSYNNVSNAFQDLACSDSIIGPTRIQMPTMRALGMFVVAPGAPVGEGGGCAWVGGRMVFRSNLSWATMAQEAGHAAGMRHSSNAHGETEGGSAVLRWAGDHGQLSRQPTWGYDTTALIPLRPETGAHVHDYMSYGGGVTWTAVDTWKHMFDAFLLNDSLGESRGSVISGAGGSDSAPESIPTRGAPTRMLSGVILPDGTALFADPRLGAEGSVPRGGGPRLVLSDAAGSALFETTVTVMGAPTHAAGDSGVWFQVEVPLGFDASSMALFDGDELLGSIEAAGTVDAPDPSVETDAGNIILRWAGQSGVRYLVEARQADGDTWWPVAETDTGEATLDPAVLGLAGSGWVIRVQATDGIDVAAGLVEEIDFGVVAPTAEIVGPADQALLTPGVVDAIAVESMIGSDSVYRWSMNGEIIGEGLTTPLPLVIPGVHVIELTVENSAGAATDRVEVQVGEDADLDGLPDDWERIYGLDPTDPEDGLSDVDLDGLTARQELELGTSPDQIDSDADDFADQIELAGGSNPLDPTEMPGFLHGVPGTLAPRVSEGGGIVEAAPEIDPIDDDGSNLPLVLGALGLALAAGAGGWFLSKRRTKIR